MSKSIKFLVKKGRLAVKRDRVECLHTKAQPWLRRRRRLMVYQEKFALQGVMCSEYTCKGEDGIHMEPYEMNTLIGNTFSADVLLLLFVCLFTHVHFDWGK